jgi:hypothetical protein
MHIIIVQIVIHSAKVHSIMIYKHEINLKLYALTFKIEIFKKLQENFLRCFYLLKYNLTINVNVMPKLLKAKVFLFPYKWSPQK